MPTDIVGLIDSGTTSGEHRASAPRAATSRDANLGNEGAYDGLSGVALTLAEYDALIEWYDANGTYPKRTLKVALLDASRGATPEGLFTRDGSKYYAANLIPDGPQGQDVLFANMDSLGLNYPGVPPRDGVLLEQRHRRRRQQVHEYISCAIISTGSGCYIGYYKWISLRFIGCVAHRYSMHYVIPFAFSFICNACHINRSCTS